MWLDPISRRLLAGAPTHRPIVLMYHSITREDSRAGWKWSVTLRDFVAQLDLLQAMGWKSVRVGELAHPERLAPRSVVITFDDGYADNLPAYEALKARGMTATWFAVSGEMGKQAGWEDPGAPEDRLLFDAATLRKLADENFEIGSHARRHRHLTKLDDAALAEEAQGSKRDLEDCLGRPVTSFAYPYGFHDDRVVQAIAAAGYESAVTCKTGWALVDGDRLRIRRIPVFRQDDLGEFARKLVFADSDVGWNKVGGYFLRRLGSRG